MTFVLGDVPAFIIAAADDILGVEAGGYSSLGDAIADAEATAIPGVPVIVYAAIRAVVAHTTIAVEEIR